MQGYPKNISLYVYRIFTLVLNITIFVLGGILGGVKEQKIYIYRIFLGRKRNERFLKLGRVSGKRGVRVKIGRNID